MTIQEYTESWGNIEIQELKSFKSGLNNSFHARTPYGKLIVHSLPRYWKITKLYQITGDRNCYVMYTNYDNIDFYYTIQVDNENDLMYPIESEYCTVRRFDTQEDEKVEYTDEVIEDIDTTPETTFVTEEVFADEILDEKDNP